MLFVALLSVKEKSPGAALEIAERAQWQYPEGIKLVAEYWLQTGSPRIISIFEADETASILAITAKWDVYYDIQFFPAITAEEGLKVAAEMMGK